VLLLGTDAQIQWRSEGAFTEAAYAQLKDRLATMLLSHS
jgi:hypothetical protein